MKDHEPSPLAFEYPPPDSYFLKQHHADIFNGNDADADADADIVYKKLSLLTKFEGAVNVSGGPVAQSNSRAQSLSQPFASSPIHILCDGSGGRASVLSAPSALEAVEIDHNNSGTGGSRGAEDSLVTQSDEPTNSLSSKPFQATISTNTRGSSSPPIVEVIDSFQQDALPQANDGVIAGGDGDHANDDGCPPSGSGGSTADFLVCHSDCATDGPSAPLGSRTNRLPALATHQWTQHIQLPPLQQQHQQQKRQQNQYQQTSTHSRDAEDNAISSDIHQRVDDKVIQSRMDIEHRRQTYTSTKHHLRLPPFPSAVTKTPGHSSKMTITRPRVFNMSSFDRQHRFARRDYTSPTYVEDFVLTRRGSINDKNWSTSLSPRATVLPFGPATDAKKQALRGLESSDFAPSESSLSSEWSRWLPEPSPGHEIHPPTEPGSVYGVNRPKFTHRYAMYDVPFYGIENVEISSSRYQLLSQSDATKVLEEGDSALQVAGAIHEDERRNEGGAGVGSGGDGGAMGEGKGGGSGFLSDHREHIWSIAHEHEYGPETGAGSVEGNRMLRERLKRVQMIHPIVRSVPVIGSTSGSGSGSAETQQRKGYRGGETDLRIDVDHGSQVKLSQMTTSSSALRSIDTTNSNSAQLIPINRHGQVPRQPQKPRPVSEGVYGPDTFQESLDTLKNVPERPRSWRAKLMAIIRQHWKTWVCVGSMFMAGIVLLLTLNKKKGGGSGSKEVASAGQVSDGGDDLGFEGGATMVMTTKKPSDDGGKTIATKTATSSSTRSVKSTPSSTSISASATTTPSKSSTDPTSKAATVRRSTATHTSTKRRSRVARTTTSRSPFRTVASTRTPTRTPSTAESST
ncbi:hypothetical protein BGZ47_006309 [Haplosporangium gracile]|nr:hypothetical protein BGZ47_006309 [Haplosporangium gracile]